jgi:hypothetical protein
MTKEDFDSEDEDFGNDKTIRQKRMANRRKHSRNGDHEQRLKPVRNTRPRVKSIKWNPDLDEEDYEDYYGD